MNTTIRIALKLIPDSLQTQPVFLCVDDTIVSKFGTKFENVSKLFDHAAHNGSNYLNGHCFVSVMLCVPVWNGDKVFYLSVPLGYRMWQKKESKLELAASMIRQVMPEFHSKDHVIILCDSWYTKQNLVSIVDEYPNLDLINISYCAMKILPYQNEHFSEYRTKSVQEFHFELSQGIRSQIFFATFVKNIETHIKSNAMTKALKQLIHQQVYHL
ncbi:MAG: hypothetical protein OGM16_16645 [Lachnospiraceae bacterium]|nr:MAG: hypothetical protein OGM16_16645 [Lachnospiraceae bacterium]